jgi:hypothetical protein
VHEQNNLHLVSNVLTYILSPRSVMFKHGHKIYVLILFQYLSTSYLQFFTTYRHLVLTQSVLRVSVLCSSKFSSESEDYSLMSYACMFQIKYTMDAERSPMDLSRCYDFQPIILSKTETYFIATLFPVSQTLLMLSYTRHLHGT